MEAAVLEIRLKHRRRGILKCIRAVALQGNLLCKEKLVEAFLGVKALKLGFICTEDLLSKYRSQIEEVFLQSAEVAFVERFSKGIFYT